MKLMLIFSISVFLIVDFFSAGTASASDKVIVVPLKAAARAAGTDGQFLYNSEGKIAATDVWYDKNNGNYGIGVRTIHDEAKLEVGGPTFFWVKKPDMQSSIIIGTPQGWPGIISIPKNKRMDVSFHDDFINLAASDNKNPPNLTSGLTVRNNGRVGIKTTSPQSTLEVRGEIRSTDSAGHNRLWGKGRPGITVLPGTGGGCIAGSIHLNVSIIKVTWSEAAQACPAGTWVCTLAERGNSECAPNDVSTTYLNCAGNEHDARVDGSYTSYMYIPAWVADVVAYNYLEGESVRLNGANPYANSCEYRPVWCCSY